MVNIRVKGQSGEREAIRLINDWMAPVMQGLGMPIPELSRNLEQTRGGGYDIVGLPWLALEVKRHENLQVSQWWKQTVRQAGEGQIPFLMYRQNRTPWRFRAMIVAAHYAPCGSATTSRLVADLGLDEARSWFQHELWIRNRALSPAQVSNSGSG